MAQELVKEVEQYISEYISNPSIVRYATSENGDVMGRFTAQGRVFSFRLSDKGIVYKPFVARKDSETERQYAIRFDASSRIYLGNMDAAKQRGTKQNPMCSPTSYRCGVCISVAKNCRKNATTDVMKERLNKIRTLAKMENAPKVKAGAIGAKVDPKSLMKKAQEQAREFAKKGSKALEPKAKKTEFDIDRDGTLRGRKNKELKLPNGQPASINNFHDYVMEQYPQTFNTLFAPKTKVNNYFERTETAKRLMLQVFSKETDLDLLEKAFTEIEEAKSKSQPNTPPKSPSSPSKPKPIPATPSQAEQESRAITADRRKESAKRVSTPSQAEQGRRAIEADRRKSAPLPKEIVAKKIDFDMIDYTPKQKFDQKQVDALAQQMIRAGDNLESAILRQVSPVKFEVVGNELAYAAARRAAEIDPKRFTDVRSVVVKDEAREKAFLNQQKILDNIRKLTPDSTLPDSSTGKSVTLSDNSMRQENKVTKSVDIDAITTQRGGEYNRKAVEMLADSLLESGQNLSPIIVKRTGADTFELLSGTTEYLAAKAAAAKNPQFTSLRTYIVDDQNEAAMLAQKQLFDDTIQAKYETLKKKVARF